MVSFTFSRTSRIITPVLFQQKSAGAPTGRTGKTVQIRRGPAAVTGDESRRLPLPRRQTRWEGAANRTIRKPEDLPTLSNDAENRLEDRPPSSFLGRSRKLGAIPRSDTSDRGFFWPEATPARQRKKKYEATA
jgi:hypothetical protein